MRRVVIAICLFGLMLPARAADSSRPYATVQPARLGAARWTTGFWADRVELDRGTMLPAMWRLMDGTNVTHYLENFRVAAGLKEGRYRGAPFNDGDFYKWLEGASVVWAATHDPEVGRWIDESVGIIAKAQRADGYLHTPVLVKNRLGDTNAAPFQDRNNFEMYNLGHLMTAACVHHRATGKADLMAVAIKAADFLEATLRDGPPEVARSSVCPSHLMGLVDLYRETGDGRYLGLAKQFFALRSGVKDGGDDNQDRVPFAEQTEAVGHAVRANYLYAGAADLFMETGDRTFMAPLEPIWANLVQTKMHLTGGCGALFDGASPFGSKNQKTITRTHQAYGRNYELPSTTAHNETCAAIGNVLWNWRMFLATGEARFVDVMETALYNGVLSGVGMDGTNYFYTNPLRVTDPMPLPLRWSRTRVPFVSSFCCPPNLVRLIAESASYAYAVSKDAVWVNLYGGSELETVLPGGANVSLRQQTEYPWNGRVLLVVEKAPGAFMLKLRIPAWAQGASLRINDRLVETAMVPGTYLELRRDWRAGDILELDLPMPVERVEANPLVEELVGQVALRRGPVVYCLESADLPQAKPGPAIKVMDVVVPDSADLVARFDRRLLGGVAVLDGEVKVRPQGDWNGRLYRTVGTDEGASRKVRARFVPYSVWGNRGAGEMSVWLRRE